METTIFRKYDIRGKVPSELNPEFVYDFGRALSVYAISTYPATRTVALGMDGRSHSPLIKDNLVRAFQDSGLDVFFLGQCATPLVYFAAHTMPVDMAIMITASHNGPEYNGFKIVLNKEPVWGKDIERIKKLFFDRARINSACKGLYSHYDLQSTYIDWLLTHFEPLVGMSLPLVIDCAHGMAATLMPELVDRFEWKHIELLYATIDPLFSAHPADPSRPENMHDLAQAVQRTGSVAGIGFDGDADRLGVVTKSGTLVSSDLILALFAEPLLVQYPRAGIVFDVKCSALLAQLIIGWSGTPLMSATGHSLIKAEIKKHQGLLGGELSGHFFFNDRYFGFDDGIYAALRLIELLLLSTHDLEKLLLRWPSWYSTRELRLPLDRSNINFLLDELYTFYQDFEKVHLNTLDGLLITLPYGSCIVRASHTEPVICVRWESETKQGFLRIREEIEPWLTRFCPDYHAHSVFEYR